MEKLKCIQSSPHNLTKKYQALPENLFKKKAKKIHKKYKTKKTNNKNSLQLFYYISTIREAATKLNEYFVAPEIDFNIDFYEDDADDNFSNSSDDLEE